ncbi:TonB-dependent receptor [Marivirga lumbricoides]|uniref:TonB-dependent receptor n=1 Tax=Marivirga lumbricoides TaxID=1046115 RepID=A0A2T4DK46_9BACT|nr:TonB-dependent receptor [Marivirga lumbricoides]
MKTLLTFILALSATSVVTAQTFIQGIVTDTKGEALPGVNVFIEDTYDGTSTDANGNFNFTTTEKGEKTLVVSMIGFHPSAKTINCDGTKQQHSFVLKEKIDQLNAVTITAGAMEASDVKKAVVMKPLDIVTTSGAMGDVIGALTKLPGTSTVGNDGRLFVRGGDASETNIYFDGLQVGNAYGSTASNVPTRSRFNPNLFKGSFFSTGGYSAEFGQALSSALVLNSIDMPLRNQTDLSLMSIGGDFTQTLVGERNSVTASGAFMNLAPYQSIISQNMDFEKAPSSWQAEILGRQKVGKSGLLKAFYHTEHAKVSVNQEQPGTDEVLATSINNDYNFGNINYKQALDNGWSYYGGVSASFNQDNIGINGTQFKLTNTLNHVKGVIVKDFSDRLSVKNGLELYHSTYKEKNETSQQERSFNENTYNHFIESDYYLSKNLVFRAGLRSTYNTLLEKFWATPRASLAYKSGENSQVSFAYGQFKQLAKPEIRIQKNDLGNSESSHFILNYLYSKKGRTFRTEAFYKSYENLIRYDSASSRNLYGLNNNGSGYAQGFDFFYRDNKSLRETDFWITYSFTDSERNLNNFESKVTPGYAPKHNASVVMKRFIQALNSQLGFSYSWNSGYNYHNPNMAGEMQSTTRDYNNLSISWSYLPMPNLIIHFECSNVLGYKNEFGYQYATQPNAQGQFESLPIQQVADRFLFLGIFWTISKDKNANQLNNL